MLLKIKKQHFIKLIFERPSISRTENNTLKNEYSDDESYRAGDGVVVDDNDDGDNIDVEGGDDDTSGRDTNDDGGDEIFDLRW